MESQISIVYRHISLDQRYSDAIGRVESVGRMILNHYAVSRSSENVRGFIVEIYSKQTSSLKHRAFPHTSHSIPNGSVLV